MSLSRLVGVALLVAVGCSAPEIPDGRLACVATADCPSGFSCRSSRCYADAAPGSDAAADSSTSNSDAGTCDPTGAFGAAVPLSGLDTTDNDVLRSMSADERTAYFQSRRGGSSTTDLWMATRSAIGAPFSAFTLLSLASTGQEDQDPAISGDGTTLLFAVYSSATGTQDLATSTWSGASGAFGAMTWFHATSTDDEDAPYLAPTTSNVYFSAGSPSQIYVMTKNGASYDNPVVVPGLSGITNVQVPVVDASERTIYFASNASGLGNTDIFVATRANASDPFSGVMLVPNVSSSAFDFPASISADGCRLYLTSNRVGLNGYDGYVATRSP